MIGFSFKRPALLAGLLVALAACGTQSLDTQRLQADPSAPVTAQATQSIYSGRTFITQNRFHGTQIEYHNSNGLSHLWYPGNSRGVPARWETSSYLNGHQICWRYPSNSYNPVTNTRGGKLECTPDFVYLPGVAAILEGDPFNLNSGRVPYRLPKGIFSAEALATRAGIPQSRIKYVSRGK